MHHKIRHSGRQVGVPRSFRLPDNYACDLQKAGQSVWGPARPGLVPGLLIAVPCFPPCPSGFQAGLDFGKLVHVRVR